MAAVIAIHGPVRACIALVFTVRVCGWVEGQAAAARRSRHLRSHHKDMIMASTTGKLVACQSMSSFCHTCSTQRLRWPCYTV